MTERARRRRTACRSGRRFDLDAAAAVTRLPARPRRRLGVPVAAAARRPRARTTATTSSTRRWSTRRAAARGARTLRRGGARRRASASSSTSSRTTWASRGPAQNPWWWDVLTHGRESRYAEAFDIDWDFGGGKVRAADPRRGRSTRYRRRRRDGRTGAPRELAAHGVVRFYVEHVLPARARARPVRTDAPLDDPRSIRAVLERQHWELMFWRREAAELNYRRFFAVTTLAGLRVEVPWVFDESHAEMLRWVREGLADGLRIDHPDGLRRPGRLPRAPRRGDRRRATCWWRRSSSTAKRCPRGGRPTARPATTRSPRSTACWSTRRARPLWTRSTRSCAAAPRRRLPRPHPRHEADDRRHDPARRGRAARARAARRARWIGRRDDALAELLACFPVYRSYLPGRREHLDAGGRRGIRSPARPRRRRSPRSCRCSRTPRIAVARRFQQTTGPVMAKGVEDTAFYRYTRLGSLTEVGGDPSVFALSVDGLPPARRRRARRRGRTR